MSIKVRVNSTVFLDSGISPGDAILIGDAGDGGEQTTFTEGTLSGYWSDNSTDTLVVEIDLPVGDAHSHPWLKTGDLIITEKVPAIEAKLVE